MMHGNDKGFKQTHRLVTSLSSVWPIVHGAEAELIGESCFSMAVLTCLKLMLSRQLLVWVSSSKPWNVFDKSCMDPRNMSSASAQNVHICEMQHPCCWSKLLVGSWSLKNKIFKTNKVTKNDKFFSLFLLIECLWALRQEPAFEIIHICPFPLEKQAVNTCWVFLASSTMLPFFEDWSSELMSCCDFDVHAELSQTVSDVIPQKNCLIHTGQSHSAIHAIWLPFSFLTSENFMWPTHTSSCTMQAQPSQHTVPASAHTLKCPVVRKLLEHFLSALAESSDDVKKCSVLCTLMTMMSENEKQEEATL